MRSHPAIERGTVHVSRCLYEARLNQGVSMDTLARSLGCSVAQLERMETGRTAISAAALLEWVLALNLDLVVQPRRGWPGGDTVAPDSADRRLLGRYRQADPRTREAVAVMLGLDRPEDPPVRLTREGRPPGPSRTTRSLHLSMAQLEQLRHTPWPFTGNRVITALKLADGTITQLAHQACLRYSRVTRIVNGKARAVPVAFAQEIAACFGCVVSDLFTPARLYPATAAGDAFSTTPVEDTGVAGVSA
ncbi:MAG: helix-turn-helix transcriptional regulator [Vicinamibacterales bacterium]|nr:helix-turn-helix transcriptional regulator [Vicinamibacterales bacterium]